MLDIMIQIIEVLNDTIFFQSQMKEDSQEIGYKWIALIQPLLCLPLGLRGRYGIGVYHPHFPDEETESPKICIAQIVQRVGGRAGIASQA